MKLPFLILFFLILLVPANLSAQVRSKNHSTLKIEKFLKEIVGGTKFWLVECTLTNNAEETLSYLSMSCSRTDFYRVDKKEFEIEGFECDNDKNIPTVITLAPGESSQQVLRLFNRKNLLSKSTKFKVGLNLITTSSTSNFKNKLKTKNIIWSNVISLW